MVGRELQRRYHVPMSTDRYTAIRVRHAEAEAFRRLARQLAAAADRDVTQSEVLGAAVAYGSDHLDQLAARLSAPHAAAPRPSGTPGAASSDRGARGGRGK